MPKPQLLRYFGESRTEDCGQCDVCLAHKQEEQGDTQQEIREKILNLLADGERHMITELKEHQDRPTD